MWAKVATNDGNSEGTFETGEIVGSKDSKKRTNTLVITYSSRDVSNPILFYPFSFYSAFLFISKTLELLTRFFSSSSPGSSFLVGFSLFRRRDVVSRYLTRRDCRGIFYQPKNWITFRSRMTVRRFLPFTFTFSFFFLLLFSYSSQKES